jgi:hypothetical protein
MSDDTVTRTMDLPREGDRYLGGVVVKVKPAWFGADDRSRLNYDPPRMLVEFEDGRRRWVTL